MTIDPNALPTRDDVTDENRAIWAEVTGVPPEHVEAFLFDLPGAEGDRAPE
jgi:N-glycosylase/DNA lyase